MAGGQPADRVVDAAPASPLTRQMQQGHRWLRFQPDLEAAYRADQFRDSLRYLRVNLLILAVIVLAVIQIDHVSLPAFRATMPDLARVGVLVPLLLFGFALTFAPAAGVWYPRLMALLMPLGLMAIAWIGLRAWGHGDHRLFVRLVIGIIAVYFVLGLPFRSALAGNVAVLSFYVSAAAQQAMPSSELVYYLTTLLMANVICAAGAYKLEHTRRTAWLEGRLLEEIALRDGLTGIHNRRRFDEHLRLAWLQAMREHKPLALLLADIDHFKRYNDRYGHQAGDEALKAVAGVLARFARRPFDLSARYGGEEFAVLLYNTGYEAAQRIGTEILQAVRALGIAHADSDAAEVLTISIGIACVVPVERRSFSGLVQLADQALYAAKDGGRNRSALLQEEYEHMKTGYFRRHLGEGDGTKGQ